MKRRDQPQTEPQNCRSDEPGQHGMHVSGALFAPTVEQPGLSRPALEMVSVAVRDRLTVFFVPSAG
jgi:hypothetical protein